MADSEIATIDKARCAALVAGDYEALGALLADDLVHIHGSGHRDDKASYLKSIAEKLDFLSVDNRIVMERTYGDIVVANCELDQSVRVKGPGTEIRMQAALTQVWRLTGDGWKLCSFQATNIA